MIQSSLRHQVFPHKPSHQHHAKLTAISLAHLERHNLDIKKATRHPPVSMVASQLQGDDLRRHFESIAKDTSQPWLDMSKRFAGCDLPPLPTEWALRSGWTRYTADGTHSDCPDGPPTEEDCLVFDIENIPHISPYAVMACAVSAKAWYAWISPYMLQESDSPSHTIPMISADATGSQRPRLLIGHHVGYDRARLDAEYSLSMSSSRFIDTMSLHIATRGLSSPQRFSYEAWLSNYKAKIARSRQVTNVLTDFDVPSLQPSTSRDQVQTAPWMRLTSKNSLADVYRLNYPNRTPLNKDAVKMFLDPTLTAASLRPHLQELLTYCAKDVKATHDIYRLLLPQFLDQCPSSVSFGGMLHMSSSILPVDKEWTDFIARADQYHESMVGKLTHHLETLATDTMLFYFGDIEKQQSKAWLEDPWMSQMDWIPKPARTTSCLAKQPPSVIAPAPRSDCLPPIWSSELFDAQDAKTVFSARHLNNVIPLLLKLSWKGVPIIRNDDGSWTVDGKPLRQVLPSRHRFANPLVKGLSKFCHDNTLTSNGHQELLQSLLKRGRDPSTLQTFVSQIKTLVSQAVTEGAEYDVWNRCLDWRPQKPAHPLIKTSWPKWYWDLAKPSSKSETAGVNLSFRSRLTPLLLKLQWDGHPLFWLGQHRWVARIAKDEGVALKDGDISIPEDTHHVYRKLPHKDGPESNVGSPLTREFIKAFKQGTLSSATHDTGAIGACMRLSEECSYWVSNQERIRNQLVHWKEPNLGLILPQVIPMATVTRRAAERTWLAASNAKPDRVGSELKAMVRAPPGYCFVGADVDAQELWICSLMGDSQMKMHGGTAIGWMTLEGNKSAGTDMHSSSGKILGISRDQAKVFNYSRLYGAGMKHAQQLLLQQNPDLTPEKARAKVKDLYAATKGLRSYANDGIFARAFFYGGSESLVFNKLEEIAEMGRPRTPTLGCGITAALRKANMLQTPASFTSLINTSENFMTSRVNWVVQSSGVDYLHLLIVAIEHLIKKYAIDARYAISLHDELRYLCKRGDEMRLALAFQTANLWTRAFFCESVGIYDLPASVAFFSEVDVDHVLRKDVAMDCVTPSNPTAIPSGQKYTISEIIEHTQGSLHKDGRPMDSSHLQAQIQGLDPTTINESVIADKLDTVFVQAQTAPDKATLQKVHQAWLDQKVRRKPWKGWVRLTSNLVQAKTGSTDADGQSD